MEEETYFKIVTRESAHSAVICYDEGIYPEAVFSAVAQYMLGKCAVSIYKEQARINVQLITKGDDIDQLVLEFNEEVINYSFYMQISKEKGEIKRMLLEKVLSAVKPESGEDHPC